MTFALNIVYVETMYVQTKMFANVGLCVFKTGSVLRATHNKKIANGFLKLFLMCDSF